MNAKQQAQSQVSSIVDMIRALACDFDWLEQLRDMDADDMDADDRANLADLEEQAGEYSSQDAVIDAIRYETALSVEVRSGWRSIGEEAGEPEEYRIVLCTGGPHVELAGDIGGAVRVVFKDWGESGEYYPDADERAALDQFVSMLVVA